MDSVVIRINETGPESFEIVLIRGRVTNNQGRAHGAKTIAEARSYAYRILPNAVLSGARWETRSEDGVYSEMNQ